MNRFDNHNNYDYDDNDTNYLVNENRRSQKCHKLSLLFNVLLGIVCFALLIVVFATSGSAPKNEALSTTANGVFGVDFGSNKLYEPVCGKRCRCGEKCSLEIDLNPNLKTPCEKHSCKGYAYEGEAPWHVALRRTDKTNFNNDQRPDEKHHRFLCGGSIINRNWVLTAAHCLKSTSMNDKSVKPMDASHLQIYVGWHHNNKTLGMELLNRAKGYGMGIHQAKRVIMHPEHKGNWDGLHDIGLVELETPINYPMEAFLDSESNFDTIGKTLARPACLASPNYVKTVDTMSGDARCYSHGFHAEKKEQTQQMLSRHRYSNKDCHDKYKSYTYFRTTLNQTMKQWICTDSYHKKMQNNVDENTGRVEICPRYTCSKQEGSGGALTCAEQDTGRSYIQIGVQNWDLCRPNFPETYANVAYHLDFIKKYAKQVQVYGETKTVKGQWKLDKDNVYHVEKEN